MFIEFLKDRFFLEQELVYKLIMIDESVQGIKFDSNLFIDYNFDIDVNLDNIFILDGNTKSLIILVNKLVGFNNTLIVNKNNLAINKWIVKKYEEFCDIYSIDSNLNIIFSNVFNECKAKYVVIGSKSFVFEYKSMLKGFERGIIFE